jgi:hypothetical protein
MEKQPLVSILMTACNRDIHIAGLIEILYDCPNRDYSFNGMPGIFHFSVYTFKQ